MLRERQPPARRLGLRPTRTALREWKAFAPYVLLAVKGDACPFESGLSLPRVRQPAKKSDTASVGASAACAGSARSSRTAATRRRWRQRAAFSEGLHVLQRSRECGRALRLVLLLRSIVGQHRVVVHERVNQL